MCLHIAQIYNQQFSEIISYNNIVIPTRLCLVGLNHSKVALCIQFHLRHSHLCIICILVNGRLPSYNGRVSKDGAKKISVCKTMYFWCNASECKWMQGQVLVIQRVIGGVDWGSLNATCLTQDCQHVSRIGMTCSWKNMGNTLCLFTGYLKADWVIMRKMNQSVCNLKT